MVMPQSVELVRSFTHSPSRLYRAWSRAEELLQWIRPDHAPEIVGVEFEARAGAPFRLRFQTLEGVPVTLFGRLIELEEGRGLKLSLGSAETAEPEVDEAAPLDVRFHPEPSGGCRLELRHDLPGDVETKDRYATVWIEALRRLESCLDTEEHPDREFYERVTRFPRYQSRFGGFWPDRSDAEDLLEGKLELGVLSEADAAAFRSWMANGYLVLEQAVPHDVIDAFLADVDRMWSDGNPRLKIDVFDQESFINAPIEARFRALPHKVMNYHGYSETARALQATPRLQDFLKKLFERPTLAFQSLLFEWGTEQAMHQDTAFVGLAAQMEMVGSWIALEDVQEGSGELQYFAGSHRIPEFLWGGRARTRPHHIHDLDDFHAWVRRRSEERGLPVHRFMAKKGDLVIWHADLVHGGSKILTPGVTRRSLVSHYCPINGTPEWWGQGGHSEKLPLADGAYYCYREVHEA